MENYFQIEPFKRKLHDKLNTKLKWRNLSKQINQNETKSVGELCMSSFPSWACIIGHGNMF
jgi:hypothetical protein